MGRKFTKRVRPSPENRLHRLGCVKEKPLLVNPVMVMQIAGALLEEYAPNVEWNLPEQIPSKYHKLIGMRAMEAEQWETALTHLERSTELYAKAGNETRIAKCRKAIAKQAPATNGVQ